MQYGRFIRRYRQRAEGRRNRLSAGGAREKPLETLQSKAEIISAKISSYGQIKSLMDDLNTAARDLTLDRTWGASKVSSSGSAATGAMTGWPPPAPTTSMCCSSRRARPR
jgi:hypothetical protein